MATKLPSIPAIPGNISGDLFAVLSAIKTQLDYAQANPSTSTTNAVDQAQLEAAVASAVTGITKGDTGAPGAPGSNGANGKTYVLDIEGGRTSIIYDASGANPLPAMTAFSAKLYEDGVEVTPSSYSWFIADSANSLLSGTSNTGTFTPTVAGTFNQAKADNSVVLVVGYAGLSIRAVEPIAITKVGATGNAGVNGKTYTLFITGGKTNAVYDASGANPLPSPTAFGCELYEDGSLITPATYEWTVPATNSLLTGYSSTATFTPALATAFDINKGDNRVLLTVNYAGQTIKAVQPVAITKLAAPSGEDTSTPIAINDLVVTGGVLYNFLTWGQNPDNADHVDIYRASTKPVFETGTLTLNGNATIASNSASKATPPVTWDTQAYSVESFTSNGAIRFKFAANTLACMAGLDHAPSVSATNDSIDYAIRAYTDGTIHIWENASDIGSFGAFSASDLFEIEYIGTNIVYKKNGTAIRTVSVSSGQTLYFDAGLYDYLSEVNNIQIGSYADVATFSSGALTLNNTGCADMVTVTGSSISKTANRATVTKTSGSVAWDSQAYSSESYTSACGVKITISSIGWFCIGLDSNPTQDASYGLIDYMINFDSSNNVAIYNSGSNLGTYGSYAIGDEFEVIFTGSSVICRKNGSTIYTFSGVTSGTFFVDSTIYTVGTSFEKVQFGTYDGSVIAPQPLTLNTAGSAGVVTVSYPSNWDGQGFSTQSYASDCAVRFSFSSTTKAAYCGLDQSPSSSAGNSSIDHAWHALSDGTLQIVQSGVAVTNPSTGNTNWGAYAITDVFEIEYIGTSIIFKQNGATKHTAAVSSGLTFYVDSSLYDAGGAISGIQFGQYSPVKTYFPGTLTLDGNATLTADSAKKPTLTVAWDEQAYSTESIVGAGAVRFVFPSTNLAATAGLDSSPSVSANGDSIDYAIRTYTDGTFHVFENGSDAGGFGSFQATDVFEIEYSGAEIRYKRNSVVVYTSSVATGQTLYFDSSFYNFSASVSSIQIGTYATYASRGDAIVVGSSSNRVYADYIPDGVDTAYNYWIRAVSKTGVLGDWNTVGGVVSSAGTPATPLGIGDSQVSTISATKIVAYSLAAITANLGTVTAGKMESPDGNFVVDLTNKAITIAGSGGLSAADYTIMQNGQLQFWKWTGSMHQQGQSLNTIESGQAANGALVTLSKWYSAIPNIMISPNDTPVYNKDYSYQSQKLQIRAENVAISGSGEVTFNAVSRLVLAGSNPSIVVTDSYTGSNDTDTTATYTTAPNTTKIDCSVSFSSKRGTGTVPNFYYRKVDARIAYRTSPSGSWNYTSWTTTNINNDFNTYTASLSTGDITSGTYDFYVEFAAADRGGTFTNGGVTYDYLENDVYLAANSSIQHFTANNRTAYESYVNFPSFTPASGYSIYEVTYNISYGWYSANSSQYVLNRNYYRYEIITPYIVQAGPGGVSGIPSANASISYTLASFESTFLALWASVSNNQSMDLRYFAAGTFAKIKTRKPQGNSSTPDNTFAMVSYALTLSSATVIDSSGTLNWVAIG